MGEEEKKVGKENSIKRAVSHLPPNEELGFVKDQYILRSIVVFFPVSSICFFAWMTQSKFHNILTETDAEEMDPGIFACLDLDSRSDVYRYFY